MISWLTLPKVVVMVGRPSAEAPLGIRMPGMEPLGEPKPLGKTEGPGDPPEVGKPEIPGADTPEALETKRPEPLGAGRIEAPDIGITTRTPENGVPVGRPKASVGLISVVIVNPMLPDSTVIVGKPETPGVGRPEAPGAGGPEIPVAGSTTRTPENGVPVGLPAASVGVIRVVTVNETVPEVLVTVGRPEAPDTGGPERPVAGSTTRTPENGVPVGLPAVSVGVIRVVTVKPMVPEVLVTVGKLEAPAVGTNTMTALNGKPVVKPAAFVAGTRPMVVKKELPAVEVIVGKPGTALVGTTTMTPEIGAPVGIPAEFVRVIRSVVVKKALPDVEVTVGMLAAPDKGATTITPVIGAPVGMPAEFVGVISPVVVKGEAKLLANEVMVGKTATLDEGANTITPV